ncbi:MAG: sigma-70 family RNA polymerase sigma factor [Gemmatimonadetes bacterium]|nr:sigma-70 family RNA polymerase sigma factor [Gemmatimonadota bacterium]
MSSGCRAAPPPDSAVLRAERQAQVRHLLGDLPPRCSLMCALTWVEGLSHQEVADRLGVSVGAVEKQLARGRYHLREKISQSA